MTDTLTKVLVTLLLFTAVINFWAILSFDVGEVYYATPTVEGLSDLRSYDDLNTKVINPFVSSVQESEIVGTGSYLGYAAIPQMLGAMRTFFSLPAVVDNIFTITSRYIPIPSWFTDYIYQFTTLIVLLLVGAILLNRSSI